MKKKLITMLLVVSTITSSLAGCGNKETAKSSEATTASTETSTVVPEEVPYFNEEGYPIVNEEITLKIMYLGDPSLYVAPEEMPAVKRVEEKTGIKTEWEVIKSADWSTKLNLTLASGTYPDVIVAAGKGKVDFEEYGVEQGILIPLDGLIEKYMPLYNERRAGMATDSVTTLLASDGHYYTVGRLLGESYLTDYHFFINDAWLKQLNLEMPNDIESLTEVLRAFKTQDPNGNGKADEIPMTATLSRLQNFTWLFGMPRYAKWMYIDDNKQVQFVPSMDKFREYLEWVHMCYEEGLLDTEALTQDNNTVKAKLADGSVGFFAEYRLGSSGYGLSESTCVHYMPSSEEAKMPTNLNNPVPCVYITKTNQYPEATARWIDTFNEIDTVYSTLHGEENDEVYGWKYIEDGKIEFIGDKEPEKNRTYFGTGFYRFLPEKLTLPTPAESEKNGYCAEEKDAGLYNKYADGNFLQVKFDGAVNDMITRMETDLKTMMTEYTSHFVMEGVSDSKWDEFQAALKNIGMDEYVKLYQERIDTMTIYERK